MQPTIDELVPHDDTAERIVICEALLDPEWTLPALTAALPDSKMFYDRLHRAAWDSILKLNSDSKPINEETITHALRESGDIGPQQVFTRSQIEPPLQWAFMSGSIYARRILDAYFARQTAAGAGHMLTIAHDANATTEQKKQRLNALFERAQNFKTAEPQETMRDMFDAYIDRVVTMEPGTLIGPPWPWADLTRLTSGIAPLTVVAGRPGMGKSAFMLQAATHLAIAGTRVLFWSGEMGFMQLMDRYTSSACKIDSLKIQAGTLTPAERAKVSRAAAKLQHTNRLHVNTKAATPAALRQLAKEIKPDVIFADYLGLLTSDQNHPNENGRITHLMAQLNNLRLDTDIPVVVGAQLNRALTNRSNPRPSLPDLRDSGSIEQDASLVIFIHRPDYYAEDGISERPNIAEIIVAKNRHGATGQVDLYWQAPFTAFRNLQSQTVTL